MRSPTGRHMMEVRIDGGVIMYLAMAWRQNEFTAVAVGGGR